MTTDAQAVLRFHVGDPGSSLSENVIETISVTQSTFRDGGTATFRAPSGFSHFFVSVSIEPIPPFLLEIGGKRRFALSEVDEVVISSFPEFSIAGPSQEIAAEGGTPA